MFDVKGVTVGRGAEGAAGTVSRRERMREELVGAITAAAAQQLAEGGREAVSLRGIAREVGIAPASVYTYFASVDDVITAVIAAAFGALATSMESAVEQEQSARGRLRAAILAYRRWAHDHPEEFLLLYASPLRGFEAPADGPTTLQAMRVNMALLSPLVAAWAAGELPEPPRGHPLHSAELPADISPDQLRVGVMAWAQVHGFVLLELNGHIPRVAADYDAWFAAEVDELLDRLGFAPVGPVSPSGRPRRRSGRGGRA